MSRNTGGRRVQLHRALSKLGLGSRTQAWQWIRAGLVEVDGAAVTDPLTWVDLDRQTIRCRGEVVRARPRSTVLALHKPRGIVTTRADERGRPTVFDLLPDDLPYLFPVGRLDADSEGLLILTDDSALAERLTDPEHKVPKTYHVTVAGLPDTVALGRLRLGVELKDGRTLPAGVRIVHQEARTTVLEIILREGRNRQIRRMCAAVGHRVRRLVRVAIGRYALAELRPGGYRQLRKSEVEALCSFSPRQWRGAN